MPYAVISVRAGRSANHRLSGRSGGGGSNSCVIRQGRNSRRLANERTNDDEFISGGVVDRRCCDGRWSTICACIWASRHSTSRNSSRGSVKARRPPRKSSLLMPFSVQRIAFHSTASRRGRRDARPPFSRDRRAMSLASGRYSGHSHTPLCDFLLPRPLYSCPLPVS